MPMSAVSTHEESGHGTAHLSRNLGLWAIVALGLGYMTPTVIFDTFGIVSEETNFVVPLAYLMAMVAMTFTAISYGRMVRIFPRPDRHTPMPRDDPSQCSASSSAGRPCSTTCCLPLVNALILRSYMEAFFPDVTPALWVSVVVVP
jgi:putrescine importer